MLESAPHPGSPRNHALAERDMLVVQNERDFARCFGGAVAQLGERRVRNAKVEGSIPFRSTNYFTPKSTT